MKLLENNTNYNLTDILSIAKRENNLKRNYLLVNNLQAKHIPVSPNKTLELFKLLADLLFKKYSDENILIIGFAETATAIAASVSELFNDIYYIHTTRENLTEFKIVADFNEEHSHATEQRLVCNEWEKIIETIDRIVFVEDEISTGKTIINFVNELRNNGSVKECIKFSAASIINAMNDENKMHFNINNIDIDYLISIKKDDFNLDNVNMDLNYNILCKSDDSELDIIEIKGKINPRTGILFDKYKSACGKLCDELAALIGDKYAGKTIAVLGTEEFMYPAIKVGEKILYECNPKAVFTHSTTRSPIIPFCDKNYPIFKRFELSSFYDDERKTFIYNLSNYDLAVIITDSNNKSIKAFSEIKYALKSVGCEDLIFIRWVE